MFLSSISWASLAFKLLHQLVSYSADYPFAFGGHKDDGKHLDYERHGFFLAVMMKVVHKQNLTGNPDILAKKIISAYSFGSPQNTTYQICSIKRGGGTPNSTRKNSAQKHVFLVQKT